jgi:hypothetical protein
MDRIIEGYLNRFAEEFGLDKKDKDTNFEKLCYYAILKNEISYLDDNDLDDVSIQKNKGIDGICFAVDGKILTNLAEVEDLRDSERNFDTTVYFIQAKTSSKFEDKEIATFCDTVIDFLTDSPRYDLTTKAREYHNIYLEFLKLLSFIKSFNCKLFYCSTGRWNDSTSCSTTIDIKREQLVSNYSNIFKKNDTVEITPIDSEKLLKLYDKATQPLNTEFTFSKKTTLSDIANVKESHIGILPYSEFRKIIIDSDTDQLKPLFSDNVRDFLGLDEKVNDNIQKTLIDEQFTLFQLLNNGITIIAEENKGRGDKFVLNNYQIVNGCQTSNVLFYNRKLDGIDSLLIPVKLIITDDEDIRDKIIVSTNNQTQIKEEQLLALTSFQKALEVFYKNMGDGLYYERRKSQYSYDPRIKKKSIVDIREQIKTYVAMFLEEPHVVSGYFGKVYKERSGQIFLREHKHEPYYLSGLTHYKFKMFINSKKIDRKYNKARYHIFMLFRKIAEPNEKVEPSSNKIKKYSNAIIKILKDDRQCLKYFLNAIEIIDSSAINIQEQKEIYKKSTTNDLIEEFKKRYK